MNILDKLKDSIEKASIESPDKTLEQEEYSEKALQDLEKGNKE